MKLLTYPLKVLTVEVVNPATELLNSLVHGVNYATGLRKVFSCSWYQGPGQSLIYMLLVLSDKLMSQSLNTITFSGSIAYICLNVYWNNLRTMANFTLMLFIWFDTILGRPMSN